MVIIESFFFHLGVGLDVHPVHHSHVGIRGEEKDGDSSSFEPVLGHLRVKEEVVPVLEPLLFHPIGPESEAPDRLPSGLLESFHGRELTTRLQEGFHGGVPAAAHHVLLEPRGEDDPDLEEVGDRVRDARLLLKIGLPTRDFFFGVELVALHVVPRHVAAQAENSEKQSLESGYVCLTCRACI